jgi:predicted tellurium resistance membrane protein TerC
VARGLTADLFTLFGQGISVRDLVLILGGVFLVVKGVMEIRDLVAGEDESEDIHTKPLASFGMVIAQIAIIDIVFSLDSVIAAVGMANHTTIMVGAILLAVGVMLLAATPLGHFIDATRRSRCWRWPSSCCRCLPGARRLRDAHPKGYLYGAMGFSRLVECLNLWARTRARRAASPPERDPDPAAALARFIAR